MSSVVAFHPRMLVRLEETLAHRLQQFESERGRTRRIIEGILDGVVRLEAVYGLPMTDCRGECDEALRDLDALDVHAQDGAAEIERLLQRLARIASLLDGLDVRSLRGARSEES